MLSFFSFDSQTIVLNTPADGNAVSIPRLPCRLVFDHHEVDDFTVEADEISVLQRVVRGLVAHGPISFEAIWRADERGWLRLTIHFHGRPPELWGAFRRVQFHLPGRDFKPAVGWREYTAALDRPPEEGAGLQPPYGYPVFSTDCFYGLEHPMSCAEIEADGVLLYHHPRWDGEDFATAPLVVGVASQKETSEEVFERYFSSIRRPVPERAIVEINTFWTDRFDLRRGYETDLESYRRMASEWAGRILRGERGLVSHFLLDAGWFDPASLYRPTLSNGGPDDHALASFGQELNALGFQFGLWFSLNGPIGVDMNWAREQGYRVFNQGCGAGYGCAAGKTSFICLTDRRWENDLGSRLEELIAHSPVTFFKGDWDNDAIEDPLFDGPDGPEHLREAIAEAMMRIYGRMHASREDVALRGAWWLSPWWFAHVDNTHLPNSGDFEVIDFPSLTQREAALTCRDAVYHHVMEKCRTPISYDVICGHEFASAPRNPVQDTEESWMNCLAMWVSRGSHYLQFYIPPYGMQEWKSWSVREMLRWFRENEMVLWKGATRMVGGEPALGEIYGYHHSNSGKEILTLRNPLALPQEMPRSLEPDLEKGGWVQIYPFFRSYEVSNSLLASHEVVILARGLVTPPLQVALNTVNGWRTPAFAASNRELHGVASPIPSLHELSSPKMKIDRISRDKIRFHGVLPYWLESAELVLKVRSSSVSEIGCRAAVGRYPDGVATAAVPITICKPNNLVGFAQTRMGISPSDPDLISIRFPIGVGGEVHAFFSVPPELPEIVGAWVEGISWTLQSDATERPMPSCSPPAALRPKIVLLQLDLTSLDTISSE